MGETAREVAGPRGGGPWRWPLVLAVVAAIAACLLVALLPGTTDEGTEAAWEYESHAIIEAVDNRPIGEQVKAALSVKYAIVTLRVEALSWNRVREIVLSRNVDFGRSIDPDDRGLLQMAYHAVQEAIRIEPYGGPYIKVSCRGPRPEFNASLVNEIVKRFVSEDRRQAQDCAKQDLKYYRDRLGSARNQLAEIDGRIREFTLANDWLGDSFSEISKEYRDAEEEEDSIGRQISAVERELAEAKRELEKQAQRTSVKGAHEVGQLAAQRVRNLEREMDKLNVRKLDANKRISTLYVRRRKAPELLAEKRTLVEDRAPAAETVAEYAKGVRLAEKEVRRLLTEAYSSRFKVVEYARPDTTPVFDDPYTEGENGGEEGTSKEAGAGPANRTRATKEGKTAGPGASRPTAGLAVGIAIGLCPMLVLAVALAILGRPHRPPAVGYGPARRVGRALFWGVGLTFPVLFLVAAVLLYRVVDPLRGAAPTDADDQRGAAWRALLSGQPSTASPLPAADSEPIVGPKSVKSFIEGDIKFAQLDNDGMVLSVTHYFREIVLEGAEVFTINRDADDHGTIVSYGLRNPGTRDIFEFEDVEVTRLDGEWRITDEGWKKIRNELQAKMKVRLGRPML